MRVNDALEFIFGKNSHGMMYHDALIGSEEHATIHKKVLVSKRFCLPTYAWSAWAWEGLDNPIRIKHGEDVFDGVGEFLGLLHTFFS